MAIKKLEHVGVMVKDMEGSLHFYQNILGIELLDRFTLNADVELAFLGDPESNQVYVELVANQNNNLPDEGKVNHLAFTVENIEDEIQRIKSLGVSFNSDSYFTLPNGSKYIFLKGPEGEKLELFQPGV